MLHTTILSPVKIKNPVCFSFIPFLPLFPEGKDLGKFLPVHLHPFPPQEEEAGGLGQDQAHFLCGQFLAVEGQPAPPKP